MSDWREFEAALDKFLATKPSREDLVDWLRSKITARILEQELPLDTDDLVALIVSTPIE